MQITNLILFFSGVVNMVLFIVAVVHFRFHFRRSTRGRLTSVFLFAVFYASFVPNLIQSGLIVHLPHLYRTGTFGGLLAPPLMYLITVSSLTGRRLRMTDLLHLLPCAFYLINFYPFFTLSAAEKVSIIQGQGFQSALYSYSEGWLVGGDVMGDIRMLQILLYLFLTVRIVMTEKRDLEQWKDEPFNWKPVILQLILFVTLYLLPALVSFGSWFGMTRSDTYQLSFVVANMLLVALFLFNPQLMYGLRIVTKAPEDGEQKGAEVVVEEEEKEKVGGNGVTDVSERLQRRIERIRKHLEETHSYLSPEFGLTTLEKELGISGKLISQTIKEGTGQNFSGFINSLRIGYALEKLNSEPAWRTYTVEALAPMVGYKSPTSFYNNFKDQTGKTPREYIDSLIEN